MARHQIYYMQGRAALLTIGQEGPTSSRFNLAEQAARRLEKEADAWIHPFAYLIRAGLSAVRGKRQDGITWWRRAAEAFSQLDMIPYAAAARFRLGQSLGGAEGSRLSAEALEQLHALEVRNPGRYAASLAPGAAPAS
jgi:hypothetical protein